MAIDFNFVSGDGFRASLESDYQELQKSVEQGAWKAAHVLAGSIIEAILLDYLTAIKYKGKSEAAILKLSLEEAIKACQEEGVLSERSANLSAVVRGYRNLIHPGRVIRLEEVVDEDGARIAYALVNMIVTEVASRKEKRFGYTAEQLVTKIQNDPSVQPMLPDLLQQTHDVERERLLTDILPRRYLELSLQDSPVSRTLSNMRTCFREAFKQSSDDIRRKVVQRFIKILREESGVYVSTYEGAFFSGEQLSYLTKGDQELAIRHILASFGEGALADESVSRLFDGLGPFLSPEQAETLAIQVAVEVEHSYDADEWGRFGQSSNFWKLALSKAYDTMSDKAKAGVTAALHYRILAHQREGRDGYATEITALKDHIEEVPF